jgi:hypothetical protein
LFNPTKAKLGQGGVLQVTTTSEITQV